jgi:diguanylate cyclase (GGDEF)-like protein
MDNQDSVRGYHPHHYSLSDIQRLEHRIYELEELLDLSRIMSNVLNLQELYALISDIVRRKIDTANFSIFIYRHRFKTFRLVYTFGLGEINREFMFDNISALWSHIIENRPFSLHNRSGQLLYPDLHERFHFDQLSASWLVPMMMQNNVIGFLSIGPKANGRSYSEDDTYFLRQIAAQAAVCINTNHLYLKRKKEKEELDRTLYNLSLLYNIGRAMTYISDLKSLLQYILNQAIEITGAEKGSIMLYDIENKQLSVRVLAGLEDKTYQDKVNNNEIDCRSFKPGEGIAGRVFQTGRPMVVDKANEEVLFVEPAASFVRSIACIPMKVYSDPIGVINVTNKKDNASFNDEDVELLKAVADQSAVAINKAQLWEMAVTDSLTGLYVRRYFMMKFQEELLRAQRYEKNLTVIMADLDRFKRINDTYGHSTGDRVLSIVGKFLQQNIRDVDIIARFGGEEFVILLPEADKNEARKVSERLRHNLENLELDDCPSLTLSLGIAAYPKDGTDIEELIIKADAAMYAAKQSGRNRVEMYASGMDKRRLEILSSSGDILSAGL